jgi:large subunit ribosomal protein L17
MRHRVHGRKLGRTSAHRKALFRNQLTALFTHERIVTTLAKAKELRPLAEKMVTLARTGTLPARRKVASMISDRIIVRRLFDEIAPRFMDRPGGYTRVLRLGRRHGDGAELAIIEFVDYVLKAKGEVVADKKPSLMDRAKGVFGAGAKADESPATEVETTAEVTEEPVAEAETEEVEQTESVEEEAPAEEAAAEETDASEDEEKKSE